MRAVFFAFVLLCAAVPAILGSVGGDQGGPDLFGYNWIDSNGPSPMVGYNWIEVNNTGTDSGITGDDGFGGPFALGFNFDFYGNTYGDVYIGTNGLITFGAGSGSPGNTQIPSVSTPDCLIAAFWDDLAVGPGYNSGVIYYEQQGIAPNRQFVVEWWEITTLGGSGPMTFEVILNETGEIWMQYQALGSANSGGATVGMENIDGTDGLEYSYNNAGAITDNLAVMFSLPSFAVSISPDFERKFGGIGTTVSYTLTIGNTGTGNDTYGLAASGNSWTTGIYDATGSVPVSAVSVPSGASEDIVVKVDIPGAAAVGDSDNATITVTSQNDTMVSAPASLNTTCLVVPTNVAVFRDADPWGFSSVQDILTAWGIPFDMYSSTEIGTVDLSPYDKVIIPSDQPQGFYNAVESNLAWFEGYVDTGGILQFGAGSNGWNGGSWVNVPGGYTKVYASSDSVTIDIPGHQFITVPNSITDAELDGWSSSTHAYFGGLPPYSVTVATDLNGPCVVESVSGLGRYFAYGLIVEWGWGQGYSKILENIILCMEGQATMPAYALDLAPGYQSGYNGPGLDADYIVTLTNTGTSNDTYDLSATSTWPVTFRDIGDTTDITSIPVTSLTSEDFIARVSIPGGALPGDLDAADITATSQGDPAVNLSVETSTQVPHSAGWFDGFESGFTDWEVSTLSPSSPTPTNWESGNPAGAGPGSAFNGTSCAGTNLVDDYYVGADILLTTPYVQLDPSPMMLSFYNWFNMDTGGDDGGFIEISASGGPWTQIFPSGGYPWVGGMMGGYWVDGYSGDTATWENQEFDISPYSNQVVRARFHFAASDSWGWRWGWYVDDVYMGSPPPFEMDMTPDNQWLYGNQGAFVDYVLTVENTGTNGDNYDLSGTGNAWPVVFRDIGDTTDITSLSVASGTMESFITRVGIPGGAGLGDMDQVLVTATSQGDPNVWDDAAFRTQVPHGSGWFDGFESGSGTWFPLELSPSTPNPTNWEFGDPAGSGPGTAYNGVNCSGTNLVDLYYQEADMVLFTPYVQLAAAPQILSFFTWYSMDTGGNDGGFLEISVDGGPWTHIAPKGGYPWVGGMMGGYWVAGYSGNTPAWEYQEFDLGAFSGSVVQARFHFAASDSWGWQWGWYVDDVYMGAPPPYRFDLLPVQNNSYGSPGAAIDYVLTIDNTGSNNDVYDLTSTSLWPVVFRDIADTTDVTTINVNWGTQASFIARVNVPGGANPGDIDMAGITATSQGDPSIWSNGTAITFIPYSAPWFDDLESGAGFWWEWNDGGGTVWELGDPSGGVGPASAYTFTDCWGTNLLTDYVLPSEAILTTPPVDLAGIPNPLLNFQHWYYIDGPPISGDVEDGGAVEISTDGGSSWTYITPVGGYPEQAESGYPWSSPQCYAGDSGGWVPAEFDLSAYSGQVVMLRFYFWTEPWSETGYAGWYIDDVFIGPPSPFDFDLLPATNLSWGPAGTSVDFILTIDNTGSSDDTYDISASSVWPVTFRDIGDTMDITSIFVTQATSAEFIARVAIPGPANPGDSDTADITVTSQGEPMEWHSSSITTGVPFTAPWLDDFEFGIFGGSTGVNWSTTDPSFSDVDTLTSQSGTYSMSTSGGVVTVTSIPIDLSGLGSAEVRCWVQRGDDLFSEDPDGGEDLIIEYRNDAGAWLQLDFLDGSGTPGEVYTPIYTLPADALHSQFQLRFRQTGGSGATMDYWHIDDVYVGTPLGDITPPADIMDLAVSGLTDTTATLTWTAPGDDGMSGTATGYEVRYSTIGVITSGNWGTATLFAQTWTPQPGGNGETHDITGLSPGIQYWFAIMTQDEVPNWSGVSNSPTGTTTVTDVTPPSDITDLSVPSTMVDTITITWTAPGDDGMSGTATGYEVRYSTVGVITSGNWGTATVFPQTWTPQPGGSTEIHDVTGLASGTQYWFAIMTQDEVPNWSGISNSPTGTTAVPGDVTPPADITDLTVSGITIDTATLTWTAPGDDGTSGTATSYEVRYSTVGIITDGNWGSATLFPQVWSPLPGGSSETHDITGLTSGTQYWFAIRTADEIPNWAGTSNSPTDTTPDPDVTPPGVISDLTIVGVTGNSVELTWTASGDDGNVGTAASYEVRYSSTGVITDGNWNSATEFPQTWTPQAAGGTESHTITGLSSGTQFWFAVRACDEVPNRAGSSNSPSGTTLSDGLAPDIHWVRVDGQSYVIVRPGTRVTITARVDDSSKGNSDIGGANITMGQENWPGTSMNPVDEVFDSSSEEVRIVMDTTGWSEGDHRLYVYGWDIQPNHNTDSTQYVTVEIDASEPTSNVDAFSNYWLNAAPIAVTATAEDSETDVVDVNLHYSYSEDKVTWDNWVLVETDYGQPYEWSFDFPDGEGYYRFDTIARDEAGNIETTSGFEEECGFDVTSPTCILEELNTYWFTSPQVTVTAVASDDLSGLYVNELFYRHSTNNVTWGSWHSVDVITQPPWKWTFDLPGGEGYYEFYTQGIDNAYNVERGTSTETVCAYDATPPVANAGTDLEIIEGTTVTFDGSASTDNLGILSYRWSFTDGTLRILDGINPAHTFDSEGTYDVRLTVLDAAGHHGTHSIRVEVNAVVNPTTGMISGTVQDEDGNPLVGVTVTVANTPYTATTDTTGSYVIDNVPPGTYELEFSRYDFESRTVSGVGVTAGQETTNEDVTLPRGAEEPKPSPSDYWWIYAVIIALLLTSIFIVAMKKHRSEDERPGEYPPDEYDMEAPGPMPSIPDGMPYMTPPAMADQMAYPQPPDDIGGFEASDPDQ